MADKTTFIVQSCVMKRGRFVPGDRDVAPTQSGAVKRAETIATRFPGAAGIAVVADDETGEFSGTSILNRFGQIPDDFAEGLLACVSDPRHSKASS